MDEEWDEPDLDDGYHDGVPIRGTAPGVAPPRQSDPDHYPDRQRHRDERQAKHDVHQPRGTVGAPGVVQVLGRRRTVENDGNRDEKDEIHPAGDTGERVSEPDQARPSNGESNG